MISKGIMSMFQSHSGPAAKALLWRAAILTLLWGVLSGNAGWHFGIPAIIAATLVGLLLAPAQPTSWSLVGLIKFLVFFFKESLPSGIDVAYRALHPNLPIQPAWLHYPLRLPPGPGRVLFIGVISLLPGTLSADLKGDDLTIHLLTERPNTRTKLKTLEERVAALFATRLPPPPSLEIDHE